MPWCPRCDETFPQGPACPRCSARLVAREREAPDDPLTVVPGLRSIKVSRRDRRALERLSGPRAPSSRALALALVLLVFASGYLLGRVGSVGTSGPTIRALPLAQPLPEVLGIQGSAAYLVASRETIASHHLTSGEVTPLARFSPPLEPGEHFATKIVAFRRSVAVVVEGGGEGHIAFAPHGRAPTVGIRGFEVAWSSPDELLVHQADGTVVKWTSGTDSVRSKTVAESADALYQTPNGAVIRVGDTLETFGTPRRRLALKKDADVVAVSPDGMRAVVRAQNRPALWDGRRVTPLGAGNGTVLGASFDHSGEHAAVLLRKDEELTLAVVDVRGNASLKPLGKGLACEGPPAWDAAGNWVYVATGDGVLHAVEASGGRIESVPTQGVGCGVAWVNTA